MMTKFSLKTKLVFLIIFFISITTGLCLQIINSYQNHLQRYDRLIELITKANHILVVSRQIVEKDFYVAISDLDNDSTKVRFLFQMLLIKKDLQLLKDQATIGEEPVYLEAVSRMIDSFISECEKAISKQIPIKDKLTSYENASTIYPLISKNLSEFISMQINNREKLVLELKRSTDWIRLFLFGLVGFFLFASLLFGIYYTGRISASIHADMAKQKRQMIISYTENLEHTVKMRTQQIELSNKALQEFAYAASHDLQEPLRKILAFGDRLKSQCSTELNQQGVDYLLRMLNAASRMKDLINGLLQFSRITTKAQSFEPVNLQEIVRDVLSDMEIRIQETGAKVEVRDLPTIDADPLQMRQLLQNFISNALKYQHPGNIPQVLIYSIVKQIEKDGVKEDVCEISVADNGIGIDEKYFYKLFQVFQRLHTRHEYEGTGVGLAICKKIIERHKGICTISSILGKGSTFIITIPVHQVQEQNLEKPLF